MAERQVEINAMMLKSNNLMPKLSKKLVHLSSKQNLIKDPRFYMEVLSRSAATNPTAPVATQNKPIQIPDPSRLGTKA